MTNYNLYQFAIKGVVSEIKKVEATISRGEDFLKELLKQRESINSEEQLRVFIYNREFYSNKIDSLREELKELQLQFDELVELRLKASADEAFN